MPVHDWRPGDRVVSIARNSPSSPIGIGILQRTILDKAIILWDGRERNGRLASEGHYVLTLTARIFYSGRPVDRIPYDYEFFYKPEIIYKSENP